MANKIPAFQEVSFIFKFISYTGASIFIPCGNNSSIKMRLLRIFQYGACALVFFLLLVMSILEIYQFIDVIWNMDNIEEIILNVIWMTSFPLAVMSQVFYTVKRSVLLDFFQNWEDTYLEYAGSTDNRHIGIQFRPRMYCIYLLTVCVSVAMAIFVILDFPILPFLPPTYKASAPLITNHILFICALFAVSIFYAWNLSTASDLVPSLIYFHLGIALENTSKFFKIPPSPKERLIHQLSTVQEDETSFNYSPPITVVVIEHDDDDVPQDWQKGWLYYEAIRKLINQTNSLFGLMLILNHGAMFAVAGSNIFSILRWFRSMSWVILLANGLNAAATILRLTTTILMCSRLSKASDHLQSKISSYMANNWSNFKDSERQFFTAFLVRTSEGVVASPLNLYSIRPSMLLALLSLLFTYLIVMLQSSGPTAFVTWNGNLTGLITKTKFYSHQ